MATVIQRPDHPKRPVAFPEPRLIEGSVTSAAGCRGCGRSPWPGQVTTMWDVVWGPCLAHVAA